MSRYVVAYFATLVVFTIVDFVWLGFIAKDFYRQAIGHLMAEKPNLAAAVVFYVLFIGGLVYFAVAPGIDAGSWGLVAERAALFGLFCYATYDLTNLATLKGWPVSMAVADLAWGTFVSAVGGVAGYFVARAFGH